MHSQQDKIKQREALENIYGNFVEPYINQLIKVNSQPLTNHPVALRLIEVNSQSLPSNPVAFSCFWSTSVWLLVTLLYCRWMRWRKAN